MIPLLPWLAPAFAADDPLETTFARARGDFGRPTFPVPAADAACDGAWDGVPEDPVEAEAALSFVLGCELARLGPDDVVLAGTLAHFGLLRQGQQRYAEAEALFARSLRILEDRMGERSAEAGTLCHLLAELWVARGRLEEAEPYVRRRLDIAREAFGPDHPETAFALHSMAQVLGGTGRYEEAEAHFREALAIKERALGPDDAETATTQAALASLLDDRGRTSEAEALYLRALAVHEAAWGPDDLRVSADLNNLGNLYTRDGRYTEAEPLLRRSLAIKLDRLGPEHPTAAITSGNLAFVYRDLGRPEDALEILRPAVAALEEAFPEGHPELGPLLNSLAGALAETGREDEAEPVYLRSLALTERLLGPRHPSVVIVLDHLGGLYTDLERYDEAEAHLLRARELGEAVLGPGHPEVDAVLNNLSVLYSFRGRFEEAEQLVQASLAAKRANDAPPPELAMTLQNVASLANRRGDLATARTALREALELQSAHLVRQLLLGSPEQKRAFLDSTWGFERYVATILEDPDGSEVAALAALRWKGLGLEASVRLLDAIRRDLDADAVRAFDEWVGLQRTLDDLERDGGATAEIVTLRQRSEALLDDLASQGAGVQQYLDPPRIDDVARRLPEGGALLDLVRYRPPLGITDRTGPAKDVRYAAFLLRRDGTLVARDLGPADPIDERVHELRAVLAGPGTPAGPAAERLHAAVLAPVEDALAGVTELVVAPDGLLNLVPFGVLQGADGVLAGDRFVIRYVSSGRELLEPPRSAGEAGGPVVVSDVAFDLDERAEHGLTAGVLVGQRGWRGDGWAPLEGTAREGRVVAGRLRGAVALVGPEATETAVLGVRSPEILHVATHGYFLSASGGTTGGRGLVVTAERPDDTTGENTAGDPMLRSGLVLAGANTGGLGSGDNGYLSAAEVAGMDLSATRLVVLSACDTGVGTVDDGEGVQGLRRAHALAGARQQVVSLWKVDDAATVELMRRFYDALRRGRPAAEALGDAQARLRSDRRWAHPYYWAAFIASGG